jgi:hypothetical protein
MGTAGVPERPGVEIEDRLGWTARTGRNSSRIRAGDEIRFLQYMIFVSSACEVRVTIPRQLAANRRNARLGTGPRSAAGKRSVAVNALRHGLSIPVFVDPGLATEVVELAERIAKGSTDPEVRERARDVAAAQIDVERVRRARHLLIVRPAMGAPVSEARSDAMCETIQELWALDRYERRAMSRRKSAVRALEIVLCCRVEKSDVCNC